MKRTMMWVFVVCLALLAPRLAHARQYYGFTVGTANAPRPPQIRVAGEPHAVLASDAMVFVVDDPSTRFDGDMFRYGQYWFAYTRGYWYRARSPRGPYAVIDVLKVPRAIIGVPRKLWKHHPLGQAPGKAVAASTVATRAPRIGPVPRRSGGDSGRSSDRAASETRRNRQGSSR